MDLLNHYYMGLMAAAIVALWLWFKQRSDNCEKDREQLWKALGKVTGIVYAVRGCPVPQCALRDQANEALEPEPEKNGEESKKKVLNDLGMKDPVCYHVHRLQQQ
jgi:hypothetical protein